MTHHEQLTDPRTELEQVDAQLAQLFARRAWLVSQLGGSVPGLAPTPARGASVQQVLLATGAGLLGLAGLFFAAVAWTLVGPLGRFGILLVLGAALGVLASWTRPRLSAAAAAIASVAASLVATAVYAAPALWEVGWSDTTLSGYTATASTGLCVLYALTARLTGIRSWTAAAALAAVVAVVSAGTTAWLATDDVLAFTAVTALLVVAVAAAGRFVPARRAWATVLAVGAGASLLSLGGGWLLEPERYVAYALAALGWAAVAVVAQLLAPTRVPALAARTLAAALVAGAAALLVGSLPWGSPSLAVAALGLLVTLAAAHVRAVPVVPGAAAALVLGSGAVVVPAVQTTASTPGQWVAYLCVVALAGLTAGATTVRAPEPLLRGLLWWSAGAAASGAWLTHLSTYDATGPVEWVALPVGGLLLLAGAGWAVSVRRTSGARLPSVAALLPGLVVAVLPGAIASWSLTWDAGLSEALVRTVCYTLVGAGLTAAGARLRTAALLVAGEATIAVCVLAHLSAAVQEVPQWVALALAGALLLAVGARWEWLRGRGTSAAQWVGTLR